MDNTRKLTPAKAANHLNKIVDVFHNVHGSDRFPVNVDELALGAADIFKWSDPITKITEANIKKFEGMLSSNENQSKWMITFNSSLSSSGRVRFTKAHELGHYILHREVKQEFMCSREDMLDWSAEENIEAQADKFSSYLLMPLNDFREQVNGQLCLDTFSHCADRYGVSLTAAILKWLSYTDKKAVLIMSNDGFMNWASSSDPAFKAGAYFKTCGNVIPIPEASLTANQRVATNSEGVKLPTKLWFEHADSDSDLLEMKLFSEQYDCTLTLLILPKYADFWPPRKEFTLS